MSDDRTSDAHDTRPHVVIVGGGFAGIAAMRELKDAPVRITLIDRHVYNMFQPLMYQVATGGLNAGDVTYFLRSLRARQSNADFRHGLLTSIRADERIAELSRRRADLRYDAPRARERRQHELLRHPGRLRVRVLDVLPLAGPPHPRRAVHPARRSGRERRARDEIRIVIVGGGATGVEMAGALAELRDQALEGAYPEIDRGEHHDHARAPQRRAAQAVRPAPAPLRGQGAAQARRRPAAQHRRRPRSRPTACMTADGEFIPAVQVIWATGVAAHKEVAALGPAADPRRPHPGQRRPQRQGPRPHLGRRRHRGARRRPRPARPAGAAGRRAHRRADRAPARRQADRALQVPRQGHDGDDRHERRRGPAARRHHDDRAGRLAALGLRAHHEPARQRQPPVDADPLLRPLPVALRKRAIPIVGDVRPVRPNGDRAPEKWQTEKAE